MPQGLFDSLAFVLAFRSDAVLMFCSVGSRTGGLVPKWNVVWSRKNCQDITLNWLFVADLGTVLRVLEMRHRAFVIFLSSGSLMLD